MGERQVRPMQIWIALRDTASSTRNFVCLLIKEYTFLKLTLCHRLFPFVANPYKTLQTGLKGNMFSPYLMEWCQWTKYNIIQVQKSILGGPCLRVHLWGTPHLRVLPVRCPSVARLPEALPSGFGGTKGVGCAPPCRCWQQFLNLRRLTALGRSNYAFTMLLPHVHVLLN